MPLTDGESASRRLLNCVVGARLVGRDLFAARSLGGLARVPLLPAEAARDHSLSAADPLLMEGVLLASRQVGAAALSPASPLDDRLTITLRSYEIRARWRPTPHGAFAGVALARFSHGASYVWAMIIGPEATRAHFGSRPWPRSC